MAASSAQDIILAAKSLGTLAKTSGPRSWQTECTSLSARLSVMLERKLWTDCELSIGLEAVNFKAHRVVLAGASPVFEAMFYGPLAPTSFDSPFPLSNIDPETFKLMLDFIYTDKIYISSCAIARNLYETANYFMLPCLEDECKKYLLENVSPTTVIPVFQFSQMYDLYNLQERCLELMSDETEAVLEGPIEVAMAETLEQIFSLPALTISSELQLVKAADRWVRARLNNLHVSPNEDSDSDSGDRLVAVDQETINSAKLLVRDALKHIRFLTIRSKKFVEYDTSFILDESEMLAIVSNMLSPNAYIPMPQDFSTSRDHRCQKTFIVCISGMAEFYAQVMVDASYCKNSEIFHVRSSMPCFVQIGRTNKHLKYFICLDPKWNRDRRISFKAQLKGRLLNNLLSIQQPFQALEHEYVRLPGTNIGNRWGSPPFNPDVSLQDLMMAENGYVHEDSIRFELKIVAETPVFT